MQASEMEALAERLLEHSKHAKRGELGDLNAAARVVRAMAKLETHGLGAVKGTDVQQWTVAAPEEGYYSLLEAIEQVTP